MTEKYKVINVAHIVGFNYSCHIMFGEKDYIIYCKVMDDKALPLCTNKEFDKEYHKLTEKEQEKLSYGILDKIIEMFCRGIAMHSMVSAFNIAIDKNIKNLREIIDIFNDEIVEQLEYLVKQHIIPNTDKGRRLIVSKCFEIGVSKLDEVNGINDKMKGF